MLFSCEHITKCYEGVPVIQDVGLSLNEGGLVSLLGPSGVGKTTLFNALAGVDMPDEGQVFLRGEAITGVAGRVSYMLQKDLLFPYRTVLDNVILPLVIRGEAKKTARENAAAYFEQFGLSGYEKKYPHQISGGMRQRAALLRTYMMGNDVILLDEPFSALDAITKMQMHEWYLDIVDKMHLSTIFITHDVDEAVMLSDRVFILAGRPGTIAGEIEILPPRPRTREYSTSKEFSHYKRTILDAIGL